MDTNFIKYCLLLFLVLSFSFMVGQEKTIKGKVVDESGEPLPGASVTVKGTFRGVSADFDGNYSIQASQGEVLEFSFVGMKDKTQVVGSLSTVNVTLVSDTQIEEVVVTALGVKRQKKSLGYATQKVKGDIISKTRGSNAFKSLSGKVAGLQISSPGGNLDGSSRILIRGAGSVSQENRPLIVVDGIPLDNSNNNSRDTQRGNGGRDYGDASADINPDDIETLNVLKGGPAAALYGSRAQNGVILITTKKGAKGKGTIEFNSGMSFDFINIAPKIQRLYGGGAGNASTISQSSFGEETINGITYKVVDYATDESWGPRYDPNKLVLHWDAFDKEFPEDYLNPRPWVYPSSDSRSFYDVGVSVNNGISFSKGNENGTMRLSINNTKTTGIIPTSKVEKTSANFNGDIKVNDRLKVNLISNLTVTNGFNRPEIGYAAIPQQFYQFGQTSLDYERLKKYRLFVNGNQRQRTWNRTSATDPTPRFSDNPYWIINENIAIDKRTRFYGTFGAKYNITNKVYASAKVYADTYNWEINERIAEGSQDQSYYEEMNRDFLELNYEGRLHYDNKIFDEKLSVNSFIGANRRDVYRSTEGGETRGGLIVPGIYNVRNNSIEAPVVEDFNSRMRVNSIFASLTFGYDDFAYLTLTGRNDWSSTLLKENNSYFYPSISSSFVFSKFIDVDWLTSGKLRGGWASVGSDTQPYRLKNTFISGTTPILDFTRLSGTIFLNVPRFRLPFTNLNSNLRPEFKDTWEVGLEMAFLNNRIRFDVTYYDELTRDLITELEVDPSTGFSNTNINAGKLSNKGIEAFVSVTPIQKNDFSWNFTWNFNKNTNKLLELFPGVESLQIERFRFGGVTLDAVVGEPYGVIRGTNFVFDDEGNRVVDKDGSYEETRNVENLGSVLPDYNMGFSNTLSYKGIELSFLIDVQKGGKYRSLTNLWGHYSGILESTAANNIREEGIILDGVTGTVTYDSEGNYTVTNTSRNTKRISAQQYGQDFFLRSDVQNVFDADYIKLREISLSYKLPDKWTGDSWSTRLTVFGRNLAVWGLDNENFDPEVASYGSGNTQGGESGSLPSTKTYGFNVQVKF